jgi:uroporphyrinogen-III synthase
MSVQGEPLTGCVIVITADRRKRELAAALERRGATIAHAPALSTVPHIDDAQLIADTRALIARPPDVVVATTGIGFRGWIEAADAAGIADDLIWVLRDARLVARGPKARGAIQAAGLEADWVAETETAAELQDYLLAEGVAGLRIAVQHHGNGSDGLDEAFIAAGAEVQSLLVYGWGAPADTAPHLEWLDRAAAGQADAVVFTSAPAAELWLAGARAQGVLGAIVQRTMDQRLCVTAVGPVTAAPLEAAGIVVSYPTRWRLGALVRELVKHFSENSVGIPTPEGPLVMRATTAVLDGRVLPLTPTGLEILRVLAGAGGNVVPREELADLLPGGQASNHAVDAAINRLRENAESRTLVRTVVKRGYALAVSVA